MEIKDKIAKLICEQWDVKAAKVVPEASLVNDLRADSFDMVELIMAMEDEFDIDIPDDLVALESELELTA